MIKLSKKVTSIMTFFAVSSSLFSGIAVNADEINTNSTSIGTMSAYDGLLPDINEEENKTSYAEKTDYGLCSNTKDGAILHAFCWSFNTIKENMKDIADAGYTTVQTSPANKCNGEGTPMQLNGDGDGSNGAWWWHYQPIDWTIGNYQLGTRDDYKAMCEEADKYGVKIITDVLPNHTTPEIGKVADALANAAGGKGKGQLYHDNGFNEINDYNNRYECTLGQMGGLPDVNTENQGFQEYYLKYCNDLISLGCDGFRYDTAKHIGVPSDPKDSSNSRGVNDFWDVATGKKDVNGVTLANKDNLFIYGEVLQDRNIPYNEYASYMNMTASSYGDKLRGAIGSKNFSVGNISDWCHSTPDRIVTWVESHDTYFNSHPSAWMNDWQIRMCWAVIAARSGGTPLFLSRPDGSDGPSGNYAGNNVLGAKGNDQFKDPEVKAVNKFRNAMVGQKEYLRNPNGNNQILQIDRGTKGTCIINLGDGTDINSETTMADGSYKDQVSGNTFTVSGGKISGKLEGGKVACIYNPTTSGSSSGDTSDGSSSGGSSSGGSSSGGSSSGGSTTGGSTTNQGKNVAYLKLPSGWSAAYAYVYNDDETAATVKENAKWPGEKMTEVSSGLYKYEMPTGYDNPLIIFNDGNGTKYPADSATDIDAAGLKCTGTMICDGTSWKAYDDGSSSGGSTGKDDDKNTGKDDDKNTGKDDDKNTGKDDDKNTGKDDDKNTGKDDDKNTGEDDDSTTKDDEKEKLAVKLTSSPSSLSQETGTKIKLTAKATGGTGDYTYKFMDGKTVIKSGSSSSITWTPDEAKTYNITVIVSDGDTDVTSSALKFTITEPKDNDNNNDDSNTDINENPIEITSFKLSKVKNLVAGDSVKISAKATSDNGGVKYKFYAVKNGSKMTIKSSSSTSSYNWEIPSSGTYKIYVEVTDSEGKKLECESPITISVAEAVNNDDNNNDDSSPSFDNKAIMLVLLAMIASGSVSFVAYRKKDM